MNIISEFMGSQMVLSFHAENVMSLASAVM